MIARIFYSFGITANAFSIPLQIVEGNTVWVVINSIGLGICFIINVISD